MFFFLFCFESTKQILTAISVVMPLKINLKSISFFNACVDYYCTPEKAWRPSKPMTKQKRRVLPFPNVSVSYSLTFRQI